MSLPADFTRYRYDPLDRVIEVAGNQRFYTKTRLATEIQGAVHRSVFQSGDQLLAERGVSGCTLLATDQQRSVLHTVNPDKTQSIAYNVYGHRPAESGVSSLLGFNGERADPVTGHYLLGNGYRAFNPVLMRFNSPDSWSPFGRGGINAYGYCHGDPANQVDPSGHTAVFLKRILRGIKVMKKAPKILIEYFDNGIPKHRDVVPFTKDVLSSKAVSYKKLYPGLEVSKAKLAHQYETSVGLAEGLGKKFELNQDSIRIESFLLFEKASAINSVINYFNIPIPELPVKKLSRLMTKGFTLEVITPLREVVNSHAWVHEPRHLWPDNIRVKP